MGKELENNRDGDNLRVENDFLKMKMMLEKGAQFGVGHSDLSPEMENAFLQNVMAFEEQFEEHKTIKLYDKIDRPTIFRPVAEIAEDDLAEALDSILNWLEEYNITVGVNSPNVSINELYRFIVEELFEYEMDDTDMPGWVSAFTYDEFHPDILYENSLAAEDCIKNILCKDKLNCLPLLNPENLYLNSRHLKPENFEVHVNNFKNAYDQIECVGFSIVNNSTVYTISGNFTVKLSHAAYKEVVTGKWLIEFETDDTFCLIDKVQIEKINL